MWKLLPSKRAAAVIAITGSVIAGGVIAAPAASAQSGYRVCAGLYTRSAHQPANKDHPDHYLILTKVKKDSLLSDAENNGKRSCAAVNNDINGGQRDFTPGGYSLSETSRYYGDTCEYLSNGRPAKDGTRGVGWATPKWTGNKPSNYNPADICYSIAGDDRFYRVGFNGEISPASPSRYPHAVSFDFISFRKTAW